MKVVFVESDRCMGCRNCERVCAFQRGGGFKTEDANIFVHIEMVKRTIFTRTCMHCENAPCLESCPTDAIKRCEKTNAVIVDEKECIGCKVCVTACPFGNMHFDNDRAVAAKCDLCLGDPVCVKNCMAMALQFGDINELAEMKRRRTSYLESSGDR